MIDDASDRLDIDRECLIAATAMRKTEDSILAARADRVQNCGSRHEITTLDGEVVQYEPFKCNDRLCPRCFRNLSYRHRKRIDGVLGFMTRAWLITVTVETPSRDRLQTAWNHLDESLRRLRQRRLWTSHVAWGIRGLHLALIPDGFRPHHHLIVQADDIPHDGLESIWTHYTNHLSGSFHSKGPIPVADYPRVAQYLCTSEKRLPLAHDARLGSKDLVTVARAIRGKRFISLFGGLNNCRAMQGGRGGCT